jgi:hypothetical protein
MQHVNVQDNQNALYKNKYSTKSLTAIVPNIYLLFKYICIKSNLHHILSQQNTRILVTAPAIMVNSSALPH